MRARLMTINNYPPKRQRGYATIFTLLLFTAVALAVFSMYDIGQTNTDKVRLQNAADAAAYSGANMMARDFNFMAYTNRAMVANQAAIGQMVGLASWTAQMDQTTANIRRVSAFVSWVPYIGPLINRIATALDRATQAVDRVIQRITPGIISGLDAMGFVLSMAQNGHHIATIGSTYTTMTEVIEENDPDARLGLVGNALFWNDFRDAWSDHVKRNTTELPRNPRSRQAWEAKEFKVDRFEEFTEIVNHSTDAFTHERSTRWLELPGFPIQARIDKRGGTEFDMRESRRRRQLEWDWSSMDTESLHSRSWDWGGTFSLPGWDSWGERIPLGWGAAHAKDSGTRGRRYNYVRRRRGGKWGNAWHNRSSAYMAQAIHGQNNLRKIGGLRPYYDFARDHDPKYNQDLEVGDTSQGPSLGVYVRKPSSKITTTSTLAQEHEGFPDSQNLDVEENGGAASNQLGAVARAELYFKRPSRLWPKQGTREGRYVGKHEHGNLYNPYWQVRQTEPLRVQRMAANADSFSGIGSISFGGP